MSGAELDPRIAAGMALQLERRRERLAAGERAIGWKLGFGAPAALSRLGLDRPLVGFLTDAGLLADGASCPLDGWSRPVLEPEIAVHIARDIPAGSDRAAVEQAVGGLGAAIELADLTDPDAEVEQILAGDIFHRHVLLGPPRAAGLDAAGISAAILRDGEQLAASDDPTALTGGLLDIVHGAAQLLAACGEQLRAGQVVITGSVVPPIAIARGERIEVAIEPLGSLSVTLR